MALGLNSSSRNAWATDIKTKIDAGSGPGKLRVYTDPRPATGGAVGAAVLLGAWTCADPCGTVSGPTLTLATMTADGTVLATGAPVWARITDSAGTFVADMSVSLVSAGGDLQFDAVDWLIDAVLGDIAGATLTEGNP